MTNLEAIEELKHDCNELGKAIPCDTSWGMAMNEAYKMAIAALEKSEEYNKEWIPCNERMPEEHDSMFAKFKGTEKWDDAMFEKISDDVNVTVEFENEKRKTKTLHTIDGEWNGGQRGVKFKVVAWQPLPEEYYG